MIVEPWTLWVILGLFALIIFSRFMDRNENKIDKRILGLNIVDGRFCGIDENVIYVVIENTSKENISTLEFFIEFYDLMGNIISSENLNVNIELLPNSPQIYTLNFAKNDFTASSLSIGIAGFITNKGEIVNIPDELVKFVRLNYEYEEQTFFDFV